MSSPSVAGVGSAPPSPFHLSLRVVLLAAVTTLTAARAPAQPARGPSPNGAVPAGWTVRTDAFADLWFHGLAFLRLDGFHALALYDPSVRARAAGAREGTRRPTLLERDAPTLGALLRADSAFEVLHFVPLYVAG